MKYSIIIAAYNLGSMICDAIESCLNQKNISKEEYEIIAINDGSKDNTLEYIKKYTDNNNLTIINKTNGGLSHTRNYGLELAKGEYVLFLDGDDWLAENALSTLMPYANQSYDVVAYPMLYYYTESNQMQKLSLKSGKYSTTDFIKNTIGKQHYHVIPAQKKIYRREFLLQNKILFVEGILHEDNPFFVDVMSYAKDVYYINTPIYYYRQNREGSITSQCTIKNFQGTITGIEHIQKTPLSNNKYINLLISDLLIYQAIGNYSIKQDIDIVYSYFRKLSTKKFLLKLLLKASFNTKSFIKASLLFIDPFCLWPFK